MNRIVVGGGITFEDDRIIEGNIEKFESLTGTQLQYDTLDFTVEDDIFASLFITSDDKMVVTADNKIFSLQAEHPIQYGAPIMYYYNDMLIGKFHVEDIKRVAKGRYAISAISSIGLLSNSQHYGGIYNGTLFKNLVEEIIGGQIPYTIDPALENQPIYGYLPIATRRENLHQALFAMSASVKKDEEGEVYITALSKDTAKAIPDSRIFAGGTIEYPQAAQTISLSEHAYISRQNDEEVVLYDKEIASDWIKTPNGDVVRGGLILFDEPMHDLAITGSTIIESGVNYAVLAPTAECELTGKKYTHTVRQVSRPEVPEEGTEEGENAVTIDTATLISLANSENVANRLADYYGSAKTVKMDILQETETTGDAVTFSDPFDEDTEGLVTELDMKFSGILRSTAKIVADYDPPDIGNFYNNVQILTGTDTFNIPQGCEKVRVVLIAGGSSGFKGQDGEDGLDDKPSAGGIGGVGGDGGKILIFSVSTENISSIAVDCGAGNTEGNGQAGTATTATLSNGDIYTSDDGTVSSIGFIEIFSGLAYGYAGKDVSTLKAGDGGWLGQKEWHTEGYDYTDDDGTWHGGAEGASYSYEGSHDYYYSGGNGGGASHGSNGHDGTDATANGMGVSGDGADGDDGADAVVYGCGGNGGYGGGGGGGTAVVLRDHELYQRGNAGHGGAGGNGGAGADGCVIIYY